MIIFYIQINKLKKVCNKVCTLGKLYHRTLAIPLTLGHKK